MLFRNKILRPIFPFFMALLMLPLFGITGIQVAWATPDDPYVLNVPPPLTGDWWRWALETPVDENGNHPLLTTDQGTWDECGKGQSGPIWFLGGTFNESGVEVRNCTIPDNKLIFYPLVNVQTDDNDPDFTQFFCGTDGQSVPERKECAQFIADHVTALTAKVDGIDLIASNDIDEFRVSFPNFEFDLPNNNISDWPEQTEPVENVRSASDGFWILLSPLSLGTHSIVLGGTFVFDEANGDPVTFTFETEVTYNIEIVE